MSVQLALNTPSTGFGVDAPNQGGAEVTDGQSVTVKPANDISPTYPGTISISGDTPSVTLPSNVAMVADAQAVGLATSGGSNAGSGTAFVNLGALTNVRLPAGNALVSDGASLPLSKPDNTGLLAMVTTHVADDILQNVALPATNAVVADAGTVTVKSADGSVSIDGQATVAANAISHVEISGGAALVNANQDTTIQNSQGADDKAATVVIDGTNGILSHIQLKNDTDALVSDGAALSIPVTGTYASAVTFQVANGVVTGITLS